MRRCGLFSPSLSTVLSRPWFQAKPFPPPRTVTPRNDSLTALPNRRPRRVVARRAARAGRARTRAIAIIVVLATGAGVLCGCGSASAKVIAASDSSHEVKLLPVLHGGSVAWCLTVAAGAGCPIPSLKSGPIIAEHWAVGGGVEVISGRSAPKRRGVGPQAEGFALTTDEVVSVAVAGSNPIPTLHTRGLRRGLRTVALKIRGAWAPEVEMPSLFGWSRRAKSHPDFRTLRHWTARVNPSPRRVQKRSSPPTNWQGERGADQASAPVGVPCALKSKGLPGIVATGGFVATQLDPASGFIGKPFMSCASNLYRTGGWVLVGAILLDAVKPGATPGPLSAMTPLQGHPGIVRAPVAEGPALARRVAGAWIVVARGKSPGQRLDLLEHLRAAISATTDRQ
jgi:hypothetical protein